MAKTIIQTVGAIQGRRKVNIPKLKYSLTEWVKLNADVKTNR